MRVAITRLCTDDFAGHLAHNVNLSIKAIMGIVGYSRILDRLGERTEAEKMLETARKYATSLLERAEKKTAATVWHLTAPKPSLLNTTLSGIKSGAQEYSRRGFYSFSVHSLSYGYSPSGRERRILL